jgi:hypothetical protein
LFYQLYALSILIFRSLREILNCSKRKDFGFLIRNRAAGSRGKYGDAAICGYDHKTQHSCYTSTRSQQTMAQAKIRWRNTDYGWTTGNDPTIVHKRRIDAGSGGEVHEVDFQFLCARADDLDDGHIDPQGEESSREANSLGVC